MAASATLHCLVGCAIGEIAGMVLGAVWNLSNGVTIALAIALAFVFGFGLSMLPLVRAGISPAVALRTVAAADTLSIATMELVDNLVMAVIPGAMNASLVNPVFWLSMPVSLAVAFMAAWPVNRMLLERGKGHALTMAKLDHAHHSHGSEVKYIVTGLACFMIGGLLVAVAAHSFDSAELQPAQSHHMK